MTTEKRFRMRKISKDEAWRKYLTDYTDLPPQLVGTKMDREAFLNALTVRMLDDVAHRL